MSPAATALTVQWGIRYPAGTIVHVTSEEAAEDFTTPRAALPDGPTSRMERLSGEVTTITTEWEAFGVDENVIVSDEVDPDGEWDPACEAAGDYRPDRGLRP